jgi:hypothetical protein
MCIFAAMDLEQIKDEYDNTLEEDDRLNWALNRAHLNGDKAKARLTLQLLDRNRKWRVALDSQREQIIKEQ